MRRLGALACALVAWLGAMPGARAAEDAIAATEVARAGTLVIGEHVAVLRDPGGALGIAEVAAGRGGAFRAVGQRRPNFAYDSAHYWVRFTVRADAGPAHLLLSVQQASLDLVELYSPRDARGFDVARSGDLMPWHLREVPYRFPMFRIAVPAGEARTFYLHVASANQLTPPLTLWSDAGFEKAEHDELLVFGAFFGMVAALFAYNLFIWFALRDTVYLWFIGYIGCFGMVLAVHEGLAFQYLWPDSAWWANHSLNPFIAAAVMFGALFARHFLEIPSRMPRLDQVFKVVIGATGLVCLLGAAGVGPGYAATLELLAFMATTGIAVVLWSSLRLMRAGFTPARYMLFAWMFLLFFVVVASLRNFAIVPVNALSLYGMHLGLAVDVLLLSIALTTRIREIQGRMIAAQEQLIEASRHYQEVLERRARELAAANRELESFSHTVAHDLRAPLRAIDGYTSLIDAEHGHSMSGDLRRDFAAILRNTRRMARLVDGLLEFARLGRVVPVETRVDMDEMARAVAAEVVAGRPIGVACATLPAVSGDPVLLRQVWTNLIENAVKFSARVAAPEIRITCETTADEVVFCVADNGAGFDAAYADKLFGMFQRLHAAGDFEGTGVGLATVKRIVERHGGRVWAEGRPGEGARFLFALPSVRLTS